MKNGKGVWTRERKGLRLFDASLELLMEGIKLREGEIENGRLNDQVEENVKTEMLKAQRKKSIDRVLEEVVVLIDTHLFTEFCGTKSSSSLNWVIKNQGSIEITLFGKTWKTLNRTPRTMKAIMEIRENLPCCEEQTTCHITGSHHPGTTKNNSFSFE